MVGGGAPVGAGEAGLSTASPASISRLRPIVDVGLSLSSAVYVDGLPVVVVCGCVASPGETSGVSESASVIVVDAATLLPLSILKLDQIPRMAALSSKGDVAVVGQNKVLVFSPVVSPGSLAATRVRWEQSACYAPADPVLSCCWYERKVLLASRQSIELWDFVGAEGTYSIPSCYGALSGHGFDRMTVSSCGKMLFMSSSSCSFAIVFPLTGSQQSDHQRLQLPTVVPNRGGTCYGLWRPGTGVNQILLTVNGDGWIRLWSCQLCDSHGSPNCSYRRVAVHSVWAKSVASLTHRMAAQMALSEGSELGALWASKDALLLTWHCYVTKVDVSNDGQPLDTGSTVSL